MLFWLLDFFVQPLSRSFLDWCATKRHECVFFRTVLEASNPILEIKTGRHDKQVETRSRCSLWRGGFILLTRVSAGAGGAGYSDFLEYLHDPLLSENTFSHIPKGTNSATGCVKSWKKIPTRYHVTSPGRWKRWWCQRIRILAVYWRNNDWN